MCRTIHATNARTDGERAITWLRRQAERHAEANAHLVHEVTLVSDRDYVNTVLMPEIERHASEAIRLTRKVHELQNGLRPRCGRCDLVHLTDAAAAACSRREDL